MVGSVPLPKEREEQMRRTFRAEIFFSHYQSKDSAEVNHHRESRFRQTLSQILKKLGVENATIIPAEGIYLGESEPSYVLMLFDVPKSILHKLAIELVEALNQDNAVVQISRVKSKTIEKKEMKQ